MYELMQCDPPAPLCDHGGGCNRSAAPDHRLCEWHQGYAEAWRRISKATRGFPITVYVDEQMCPLCAEPIADEPTVERAGSAYHAHCWNHEAAFDAGWVPGETR